MIEEFGQVLM